MLLYHLLTSPICTIFSIHSPQAVDKSKPKRAIPAQDKVSDEIKNLSASILHLQSTPFRTSGVTQQLEEMKKDLKKAESKLKALKSGNIKSHKLYEKIKGMLKRAAEVLDADNQEALKWVQIYLVTVYFS